MDVHPALGRTFNYLVGLALFAFIVELLHVILEVLLQVLERQDLILYGIQTILHLARNAQ